MACNEFKGSTLSLTQLIKTLCAFFTVGVMLSGCDKVFEKQTAPTEVAQPEIKVNYDQVLSSANLFVYSQLSDTLSKAQALDSVVTSLLHHPNPLSLEEAQKAWVETYNAYLQAAFFYRVPRFEKPRYHEEQQTYAALREQIDSWPIEGGYIDYLPMYPLSGIVNDLTLKITLPSLMTQHGFSDRSFASIGFHPLEFMLFGPNGQRSARDFIPQENSVETVSIDVKQNTPEAVAEGDSDQGEKHEDEDGHNHDAVLPQGPQNHNRRREYLRILSAHLVASLQQLNDRWDPAHGYYAKQWHQPDARLNLSRVYQAAVDTIETDILSEHIMVLLTSESMDERRSAFSGQDLANIQAMLAGVNNLFTIENGILGEIKSLNAEVADKMMAELQRSTRDLSVLKESMITDTLAKRKAAFSPIQQRLVSLLESLYLGAEVLGIELKALPVSTS